MPKVAAALLILGLIFLAGSLEHGQKREDLHSEQKEHLELTAVPSYLEEAELPDLQAISLPPPPVSTSSFDTESLVAKNIDSNSPIETKLSNDQPIEIKIDSATLERGRALLQLMATGEGPDIRFVWPENRLERNRVYGYFKKRGMVTTLRSSDGSVLADHLDSSWRPNLETYSPFVRITKSFVTESEEDALNSIASRVDSNRLTIMRYFPKDLDAAILGSLPASSSPFKNKHTYCYRLLNHKLSLQLAQNHSKNTSSNCK